MEQRKFSGAGGATTIKKAVWGTTLLIVTIALGGCGNIPFVNGGPFAGTAAQQRLPTGAVNTAANDAIMALAKDEVLGSGPVRIALLLPLSAQGNAGGLARDLRNASKLAIDEVAGGNLSIIVKDTGGRPTQAAQAASHAIAEGAQVILGPLLRESVASTAQVARLAGVPILGFSTDARAAGSDVYLMSLLPQTSIDRILRYAHGQGMRNFAAILPDGPYGALAEQQMRQTMTQIGGSIQVIAAYQANQSSITEAATRVRDQGFSRGQIDAVLIPDVAENAAIVVNALRNAGINTASTRILGSSQWTGSAALRGNTLNGAWYSALENKGFEDFTVRYRAAYGTTPLRNATFAYDATLLAAAITSNGERNANFRDVLASTRGFNGIDGIFRLHRNGTSLRGLAIYQVTASGVNILQQAPRSFRNGSQEISRRASQ